MQKIEFDQEMREDTGRGHPTLLVDERRRLLGFYIISMLFVSPSQFQKQIDHAIGQEQMNSAPRKMQIGGFN